MQSIMHKGKMRLKSPIDIIKKEQKKIDEFNNKQYDIRMKAITERPKRNSRQRDIKEKPTETRYKKDI